MIAQAMGAALGFTVEWLDKVAIDLALDEFPEQVQSDFHRYNGLPTFGNIFDNGSNAAAQVDRHAGRVCGGSGKIYRNFFYLPDRRFSVADVPASVCRALFGREISLEAWHSPYLMPFLDQQIPPPLQGIVDPHSAGMAAAAQLCVAAADETDARRAWRDAHPRIYEPRDRSEVSDDAALFPYRADQRQRPVVTDRQPGVSREKAGIEALLAIEQPVL